MKALDEALLQIKKPSQKGELNPAQTQSQTTSGNQEERKEKVVEEDEGFDIEAAMEAELRESMENGHSDTEEPVDYNLIKNFLESYKSQAGLSGPVSNLAGRLQPGFNLPRDES
jgi:hypothetical protein